MEINAADKFVLGHDASLKGEVRYISVDLILLLWVYCARIHVCVCLYV